jgi:hypothetical protein
MMSSAIPARLEYQCGHAALVSLPRIKGETSAQRNQRVAHEKSAALARQCDFCAPVVEVSVVAMPVSVAPLVELPVAAIVLEAVADGVDGQVDGQQGDGAEPFTVPVDDAKAAPGVQRVRLKAAAARTPRARTRDTTSDRRQFLVQYRVDRLIRAVDVRDALRQVASFGATDVLEIARQD